MITEAEKARIKELRDVLFAATIEEGAEDVSEEFKSQIVGTNMALIDGVFAIREGEPWRGMTDPKEIARAILRQMSIGD